MDRESKVGDFVYYRDPSKPSGYKGAEGYGYITDIVQEDHSRRYEPQKISIYIIVKNMYLQDGTICDWVRGTKYKIPTVFVESAKNTYEQRMQQLKTEMENLSKMYQESHISDKDNPQE